MAIGGWASVGDPGVADAVARSHLGALPADIVAALLEGAARMRVPAGATVREVGEDGPHLELIARGLARIFVTAPDGRTLTIRYLRPGDLSGVVSLFAPMFSMPGSVQALVDSDLISFRADVVIDLADHDLRVARALIDELSERVVTFVAEIPGTAFSTVRQRVARHLLDLASEQPQGGRLIARVSQQGLADAVGSVREVVVRVLHDLRSEGVIQTSRDGIEVLLPERLIVEQYPARPSRAGGAAP
jgi:CRP/FNR family transcriptional regulator, cyclic AMP receptor protein